MRARIATVACVLSCVAAARVASAQPADVDALIERGVELREQGKDEQALEQFDQAFAISHGPRAQAQLALAQQALGRWVAAESNLVAALAASGDAWIGRNRRVLERSLATIREHLGDLELRGGVAGAEVLVNGARVATMPLERSLRVEAGTSFVEVRAPGYYPIVRRVTITPNGTSREAIDMQRLAAEPDRPPATAPPIDATAPAGAAAVVTPNGPADAEAPRATGSTRRTLAWVSAGSAGGLAALGVVALLVHDAKASAYNDDPTCPGTAAADQPASCRGAMNAASTWQTVSIAGFVGAGALALGSAILFLTEPRSASRADSLAPRAAARTNTFDCSPSLGWQVTCRLAF